MSNIMDLGISANQYIATMENLIGWYIGKLVWPDQVIFTWDDRVALDSLHVFHWLLLLIVVGTMVWLFLKGKGRIHAFSICLLFVGFLPAFLASFTYTPSMKTVAIEPHWFGFTSIGFFILTAYMFLRLGKYFNHKFVTVMMVVIIMGLAAFTYKGNAVWKNAKTFCGYWLNVNSTNGAAWNCLAKDYIRHHDQGKASGQYSSCEDAAYLGWAYHTIGQAQSAYDYYSLAIRKDPQCVVSYYGLGLLYGQLNDREASRQMLAAARKIEPDYYPAYLRLADVFSFNAEKDDARRIAGILRRIEEGKAGSHED